MKRRLLWAAGSVAALALLWAALRPLPGAAPDLPPHGAGAAAARPGPAPEFIQLAAVQMRWRGSWKAVAADGRFEYAVNPMMAGRVLNLGFFGQSSIIAREGDAAPRRESPGSTLPDGPGPVVAGYTDTGPRPGFLAVAPTADRDAVLVVKVPRPAPSRPSNNGVNESGR